MFLRISLAVALALLAQNPAPQGVRVSGQVAGLPPGTPSGMMRANLMRQGGAILEALGNLVDADGRFEFSNVPPGQYTLRILGPNPPSMRVTVAGADITNLSLMRREMNAVCPLHWPPEKLSLSIACAPAQPAPCRSRHGAR